jgi:hypothetical protein
MYRSWSDHMESPFNSDATPMGIVNSDPFTRVKLGPSHRQFLQTAAVPCGAAMLSLGMDEAFAQRRQQHAGRLRARPRRRASTSSSTLAPAPSTPLAARDGVTVNSICPGPIAPNLPPVAREVAQAQARRTADRTPEQVGECSSAVLLASDEGTCYVGVTMSPDGGDVML